jgi:hypothetical protein
MGDWEDMESLSSYDKGKGNYAGRSYKRDLAAAWEAREMFNAPTDTFNKKAAEGHRQRYKPTKYALGGNHFEGRIARAVNDEPMLKGTIGVKDGRHSDFGWDYVPFLEPVGIEGFAFQHYFTTGIMGRPIGGESPGLTLIKKQFVSSVQGHNHLFDIAHRTKPDGSRLWGISAGCFLDKDQHESYAGPSNHMWWRGLILLKGCKDGDFEEMQTISIEELERQYGSM